MDPFRHPASSIVQVGRCSSDSLSSGPTHKVYLSGVGSQDSRNFEVSHAYSGGS